MNKILINRDLLESLYNNCNCTYTKGYLRCILDTGVDALNTGSDEDEEQVMEDILHRSKDKIEAIKLTRGKYGLWLKDAKKKVEHYMQKLDVRFT